MSSLPQDVSALSPSEKRALLTRLLRQDVERADGWFPLNHTQRGIWFLYRLAPDIAAYTLHVTARIRSAIDGPALRRAFETLVRRHPALRTTFRVRDGEPVQRVHDDVPIAFEEIDASSWTEAALAERLVEDAHRPFDLERGPMLRASVFGRSAGESVLLVIAHHIALDFWSFVILLDELRLLYPAARAGSEAALPPLPLQFSDYVRWQSDMLAGPRGEGLWSYWGRRLAGDLPVLELPTDRPRPPIQTYGGASRAYRFERGLVRRLKALAAAQGSTLYMVCLAAFQVLLHRYTGQDEILLGVPTAGRTRPEFEGLVGCLPNPVILRADLSGNPTFKDFLGQVRRTVLEALEHEDFPALLLMERLKPPRYPGRPLLYQAMFNMVRPHRLEAAVGSTADGGAGPRVNLGGLDLEWLPVEYRVSVLDLEMTLDEMDGALGATVLYNRQLFDAATIIRLTKSFETLLQGVVANPDQLVGNLPLLTDPERHQILVGWNATETDDPSDTTLQELFEAQARRVPDAVAVMAGDTRLTYRDLNRQANRVAHRLRVLGVGPEVPVGLCVERSPDLLIGLLGILKAGGAYVPLDPSYPAERLAFMIGDARLQALVTQERLLDRLPAAPPAVICLDALGPAGSAQSAENPVAQATGGSTPAYIIYTSGSTGRPKGVLVCHRNVVNHALAVAKHFGLGPDDRVLQFSTISFDAAVEEILPTWFSGATLVLRPDDLASGQEFLRFIERAGITVLDLPTAFWHAWVAELESRGASLPPSLRLVVVGGEKASAERLATWRKLAGDRVRWINTYGPTETTVTAMLYEPPASDGSPGPQFDVPIGRPLANTKIYVLDGHQQPVPIGVTGEIYIGGAGVARGYLNRPELTAEKFVPDPFSPERGSRMFRTGDLARYRADGNLLYVGRADRQVKIRGFRVEPGEVEAALGEHPRVQQSAVVARPGPSGDPRLVGYVVAIPGVSLSVDDLRSFLKSKVPDYMIPSACVLLDALPRTPSGKLDARALPDADPVRPDQQPASEPPRTPTEMAVAAIFARVLAVERVGIHDDYFDLGGHSLMAMRLMSLVQEALGVELPLRVLFEAPTVASLATRIEAARRSGGEAGRSPLVGIQPAGSRPPIFCAHPLGGSALCYVDLARYLGPDQPVYGLEALDGGSEPHANLHEMARHYVETIRARQPRRPYLLAGWSFGGLVAFEMARQLAEQHEDVALLALFDTWAPRAGGAGLGPNDASPLARLADDLGRGGGPAEPIALEDLRTESDEQLKLVVKYAMGLVAAPPDVGPPQMRRVLALWAANMRAALRYEPPLYAGRITLFRSEHHGTDDHLLGWGRFTSEPVEVHVVPGDHYAILVKPHVAVLAARLRDCLDRVSHANGRRGDARS